MSLLVLPRPAEPVSPRGGAEPVRPLRPAPAPRRHLRVVPDPETIRRRHLARVAAAILGFAVAAGLMAIVSLHVMLAQGQVHVDHLEKQVSAQEQRQQQLRLEVAALEAPQRVVTVAGDRLGMVPVDQVRYLTPPPPPLP